MNVDFEKCLEKKKVIKFPKARTFVKREIREAESDLN